jgi:hypothetical protein
MKALVYIVIAVIISTPSAMAADTPIGSIKTLEGTVHISRQGIVISAKQGHPVFQQDTIRTDSASRVGIVLHDDTTLSLGPHSVLELKDYVFKPKDNDFSLVVRMLKGTFVYLSGVMGKLAPDAIRLETPDSTIGIRGTRLLIQVEGH